MGSKSAYYPHRSRKRKYCWLPQHFLGLRIWLSFDEIDATHVSNIPIPLLKNHDIQKRINDLALEANQKRYEAYKLEQKALEIMDREVIYAK